jgi:phosphoglucan, water dikinase
VQVRSHLVAGLATGLRNDAPDTAMAMRQRWRLAELRCEDYAFLLLSRYVNEMESSGTPAALAGGRQDAWAKPLGMLVLSVRHLGLSGWAPAECMALDTDIGTWQKLGATSTRVRMLTCEPSAPSCSGVCPVRLARAIRPGRSQSPRLLWCRTKL